MTTTSAEGLLPCPFCGTANPRSYVQPDEHGRYSYGVQCVGSECSTCGPERGATAEAIAAWNRRAELYRASPAGGDVSSTWEYGCDAPRNGGAPYIGATIGGHFVRFRIEDDFADAVKRHTFLRTLQSHLNAAPAGGDVAVGEIGELNGTKLIVGRDEDALARLPKGTKLYTRPQDSAHAGSGEVDGLADTLVRMADNAYCDCIRKMQRPECLGWEEKVRRGSFDSENLRAHVDAGELLGRHRALHEAAALLRKLQQGAEYETPSIECYSYDGDQWFDAPDDVELVAGRRTGDTFELMVSHYSIQRKYVVKKAPDSFGDDYEVEPVRAASQDQDGGKA